MELPHFVNELTEIFTGMLIRSSISDEIGQGVLL